MSSTTPHLDDSSRGWLTLIVAFVFVLFFRIEQNIAYVFRIPSTRELIGINFLPVEFLVNTLAPFLHVTPTHLIGTLIWFIPFSYLFERRASWEYYVGFVVLTGYATTTIVPAVLLLTGVPVGQGIGASGITHALIAHEATVRSGWVFQRRSQSWLQRAVLVFIVGSFLLKVVGILNGAAPGESVVAHATGLILGVFVSVGGRYVSLPAE